MERLFSVVWPVLHKLIYFGVLLFVCSVSLFEAKRKTKKRMLSLCNKIWVFTYMFEVLHSHIIEETFLSDHSLWTVSVMAVVEG